LAAMRSRMVRLLISLIPAAAVTACVVCPTAGAASPAPRISATVPAHVAARVQPRLAVVVRHAPRGARVVLQERSPGRWTAHGTTVAVAGNRTLTVGWRGLRGRASVGVRLVLLAHGGRMLDATTMRRVQAESLPAAAGSGEAPVTGAAADPAPAATPAPAPDPDPATAVATPTPTPTPTPAPASPLVLASSALRLHSLGVDRWDVWVCGDVTDGSTAAAATAALDAHVVPFYTWLSGGRYQPQFRARGTLAGTDVPTCEAQATAASAGRDGAVILNTARISAGPDDCVEDQSSLDPCAGRPTVLPGNARLAWLSPGDLLGADPHFATAVHELGHTLTWPHSFTGRLHITYMGADVGVEYDDPFDVMGYERLWGTGSWTDPALGTFTPKATQAFNRIAVGWVPQSAIATQAATHGTYAIGPLDEPGTQVVIVPTADPRAFLTLEARVVEPLDPVPGEGVVVHAIDQRPSACDTDALVAGCWADSVRESPAPNTADALDSLVTVGGSVDVAGVHIAVTGRTANRFTVTVDGAQASFALKPTVCLLVPAACAGGRQGPI
jgi:hypothetical protein